MAERDLKLIDIADPAEMIETLNYFLLNPEKNRVVANGRKGRPDVDGGPPVRAPSGKKMRIIRSMLQNIGATHQLFGGFVPFEDNGIHKAVSVLERVYRRDDEGAMVNIEEGARKMGITQDQIKEQRKADAVLDPKKYIQSKINDQASNNRTVLQTYNSTFDKYFKHYGFSKDDAHTKAKEAANHVEAYLKKQHNLEFPESSYKEAKDRIRQEV